jgi:hypothetical protein
VRFHKSQRGGFSAPIEGLALGTYEVWLYARDPARSGNWRRIGAPQKVVLDVEHESVEIEFEP